MKGALGNFFSIEDINYRKVEKDLLKEKVKIEEYKTHSLIWEKLT